MDDLDLKKMSLDENWPHLISLESLLSRVIAPAADQLTHIISLTSLLASNDISKVFTEAAHAADSENQRITRLVTNLVKVPDRTISMLGLDQATLPAHLYPKQYCSLLLRNLSTSLRLLVTPSSSFNPTMFCCTIRQQFLTHRDQIQDSQLWQFLAKWTLQSSQACSLSAAMMRQLDMTAWTACLLAAVRHVRHPLALQSVWL